MAKARSCHAARPFSPDHCIAARGRDFSPDLIARNRRFPASRNGNGPSLRLRGPGNNPVMASHMPSRGSNLLRRGRYSEAGRIYLVTFATAGRIPVFSDWTLAKAAVRESVRPEVWPAARLLCWVLMPDHWHGLVELGAGGNLSRVMQRLKGRTGRAVNEHRRIRGSLWATGFHDHAIRADEDLVEFARYIVLNPVRAGLVARVGDYPFWDAIWVRRADRN